MELLGVLMCLLAVPVMAFLRSYGRRARARLVVHKIGDPAVAHRALIDNADDFSNRPAGIFPVSLATWENGEPNENITTVRYGPHWSALRCNLTAGILHPTRLASLAPLRQEAAQALVAELSGASGRDREVTLRGHITAAVFPLVARLCFGDGVDGGHVRAMGTMVRDFLAAAGELNRRFDGSMLSKIVNWRALRHVTGLIERQAELYRPLIEARRRSRSPLCGGIVHPYIDSLLDLRVPDDDAAAGDGHGLRELRDGEVVGLVLEFLAAGMGSVSACVEWTLAHLIDRLEVQDKLRREIDGAADATLSSKTLRTGMPYLNAVVLESLRMHPPMPVLMRAAHGEGAKVVPVTRATTVPAEGLRVMFSLGDIGRDGKTWTDPDEFLPERFLPGGEAEDVGPMPGRKEIRMMPFGAGHRHCPGMSMGMLHTKCFVVALVREFEWAPSAEDRGGGIDMTELDGFSKLMKKPLTACVTRRT
ncbi:unnamed protein product [Triticum turgidum subsp. durum]|uniref:Cytochrome P450 n=1 Tax=Triticum turgidum subsp. durum TaxID=4567 RepID=A0A9R1AAG0_TRITD|nr:unnamed protein product [Triticum turgidum subsp. durum]